MKGINELYVSFANDHISLHEKRGTIHEISRSDIERTLLEQIDQGEFPIDYKVSWYHAVRESPHPLAPFSI